ncbi:5-oxoprolinase (ATP-hydrolyzing) [Microdochium nivale]|nr:5-oxoprolinase (ATP-hydrolyzing) [Microdochium nivale]
MKCVPEGEFLETDIRADSFPGCSATRWINNNSNDLKAQIASNQRGIVLLDKMCREFGLAVVYTYMFGIQANAEVAVRDFSSASPASTRSP